MTRLKKHKPALWKQVAGELRAKLEGKMQPRSGILKFNWHPKEKRLRRINAVSKKRQRERREYLKLRSAYLLKFPACQFPKCIKSATEVHHKSGRGKNYLRQETWAGLCKEHHDWCHNNIAKARELGLMCEKGRWMA